MSNTDVESCTSSAQFRNEQLSIMANIAYTNPPVNTDAQACLDLDAPGVCPLRPGTVAAQHGSIPIKKDGEMLMEVCNTFNWQEVRIFNARAVANAPTLTTIGFQLINVPRSKVLSTPAGMMAVSDNDDTLTQMYYNEISEFVCKATRADAAFGYCHAMRGMSSTYAGYAHADQSHKSWSARLPELVNSGMWASQGPPGISSSVAERAASSSRYGVVSAWRYLGPSDRCRASHLAVLDQGSIKEKDLMHLSLLANGCLGGNYRLASNTKAKERHAWYYYPEMTPEEILLFTAFDSDHPAKSTTFANSPIATCIHSGFNDPNPPENEPPRQSIDVRFLLIWD